MKVSPLRALTLFFPAFQLRLNFNVEMKVSPLRALTHVIFENESYAESSRNESKPVEGIDTLT